MRIGLTYDLRSEYLAAGFDEMETAEFDREDTIEALEAALRELGHETDRVGNAWRLAERLVAGHTWDLVFNIAEGLTGYGREAQIPALLDLYQIPYTFSDTLVMAVSLHKGMTKRIMRDSGIPTADFAVLEGASDAGLVDFDPPWFVKPVAEGTGKGVSSSSIVRDAEGLPAVVDRIASGFGQPVIVERLLEGREFTVGLTGTGSQAEAVGTLEIVTLDGAEDGIHSYVNKERCEELIDYRLVLAREDPLVAASEAVALASWRALGCRDAGRVDVRCDGGGRPMFLEVNPLAGLHPTHSDLPIVFLRLGIPYVELIDRIVRSASTRLAGARRLVPGRCA
jgi:D-alanine-D-alanine ligase